MCSVWYTNLCTESWLTDFPSVSKATVEGLEWDLASHIRRMWQIHSSRSCGTSSLTAATPEPKTVPRLDRPVGHPSTLSFRAPNPGELLKEQLFGPCAAKKNQKEVKEPDCFSACYPQSSTRVSRPWPARVRGAQRFSGHKTGIIVREVRDVQEGRNPCQCSWKT